MQTGIFIIFRMENLQVSENEFFETWIYENKIFKSIFFFWNYFPQLLVFWKSKFSKYGEVLENEYF